MPRFIFCKGPAAPPSVDWLSGIRLLPENVPPPAGRVGSCAGFFYAAFGRGDSGAGVSADGTLFMSIGLHAGWIFWLTVYRLLTVEAPGACAPDLGQREVD